MHVVYEKIVILDKYLVDHCWTITCDHQLDGPQLIPRQRQPGWCYKQDPLMRGRAAMHQWISCITDAAAKT